MARRFFHGTTAVLVPGDLLVPGDALGKHAHGHTHLSAHVYATSGTSQDECLYARAEAEEWGSEAADAFCDGSTCGAVSTDFDFAPHHDAWRDGDLYPCVRVYEIEPIEPDTVEPDPSSDVVHGGMRMSAARIVALL